MDSVGGGSRPSEAEFRRGESEALVLQQVGHLHTQHFSQGMDHTESRIALPPLDTTNIGEIQPATISQLLLCHPSLETVHPNSLAERLCHLGWGLHEARVWACLGKGVA